MLELFPVFILTLLLFDCGKKRPTPQPTNYLTYRSADADGYSHAFRIAKSVTATNRYSLADALRDSKQW
jgi:hypothetical protein